ncbi:MAG: hypothetical protein LKI53_03805 [Bacteroidales bacterium]|jgi:hypothetical protein|nr:hypothetical protein [Bacteroidales bacterium]
MTIEYNILWVEDNESWYSTTKELFTYTLNDLGFNLISKRCETLDEVKSEIEKNKLKDYDLLLIDFTLGGSDNGEEIIQFIRNINANPILTDIIFYSSDVENVRDSMQKNSLEGVYTADRKEIETKFEQVVNTTIKKVQDLNNMRGLIMAETSDIDKSMMEIISTTLNNNSFKLKDKLKEKIISNVENKIKEKNKKFNHYQANDDVEKIIKDPLMFDASEKLKATQYIFEEVDHDIANKYKSNGFSDCYEKIINKRNLLGHETPKDIEGKRMLGSGESQFEFNDDFCIEIRKKVREYANDLTVFLNNIK